MTFPIPKTASALRLAGASLAALAASALPAAAQSPCGDYVIVEWGDTLNSIASRCGVSLNDVLSINPDINNPQAIQPGQKINMPENQGQNPAMGTREAGNESVARQIADVVVDFFSDSPQMQTAEAEIEPSRAAPGSWIDLSASGFQPDSYVLIGVGRPSGEFQTLSRAQTNASGALSTQVRVPNWISYGEEAVFVVAGPDERARTARFEVVSEAERDLNRRLSVTGSLTRGEACPLIETAEGETYALTNAQVPLRSGQRVRLSGYTTDLANCSEGRATIAITDLTELAPARPETETYRGFVAQGAECLILRAMDGETYSLGSGTMEFEPGDFVEIEASEADVSFCLQGEPLNVQSVRAAQPPNTTNAGGETAQSSGPDGAYTVLTGSVIDTYRGCSTLRTADNEIWKLADFTGVPQLGDDITVSGRVSDAQVCGSGQTLDVEFVRASSGTVQSRPTGETASQPEPLRAADLTGDWVGIGGNCSRPDLRIQPSLGQRHLVASNIDGQARYGFVRGGDQPALIFQEPRQTLRVRALEEDDLAIFAPFGASNVSLGNVDVNRSGSIFTRCDT